MRLGQCESMEVMRASREAQQEVCARHGVYVCATSTPCDGKRWKVFLESFHGGEEALYMIIENGQSVKSQDIMFLDAKRNKELLRVLTGIVRVFHRLNQTLFDVWSIRGRLLKTVYFSV